VPKANDRFIPHSAFAGPFSRPSIGIRRTNYRHSPDLFGRAIRTTWLGEAKRTTPTIRRQSYLQIVSGKQSPELLEKRPTPSGPTERAERTTPQKKGWLVSDIVLRCEAKHGVTRGQFRRRESAGARLRRADARLRAGDSTREAIAREAPAFDDADDSYLAIWLLLRGPRGLWGHSCCPTCFRPMADMPPQSGTTPCELHGGLFASLFAIGPPCPTRTQLLLPHRLLSPRSIHHRTSFWLVLLLFHGI